MLSHGQTFYVLPPQKKFGIFFIGNGAFWCIARVFLKLRMPIAWSDIFEVKALYGLFSHDLQLILDRETINSSLFVTLDCKGKVTTK